MHTACARWRFENRPPLRDCPCCQPRDAMSTTTTTRPRPAARAPLPRPMAPPQARARRSAAVSRPLDDTVPPAPARRSHPMRGDLLLYALLSLLVALAWPLSRTEFVRTPDPNYWIGVTGGSLLLPLFSY